MALKCPGRSPSRRLDSVQVQCSSCGRQVEFFTDEIKRRCKCGRPLLREAAPKCAEWCPAAEQCLGEAIDSRLLQKRLAEVRNDPRAKECVGRIRRLLEEKRKGKR